MLSRVADDLYWFGRYLQRAENTARLASVNSYLLLDLPKQVKTGWQPLVEILGTERSFAELYAEPTEANIVSFLLTDERSPSSILSSVRRARELLRGVRDTLPHECWEKLNDIQLLLDASRGRTLARRSRLDFLGRVIDACLLVTGILEANMSRDTGFQLLRLGTKLEQADMTTRILDVRSVSLIRMRAEGLQPFENIQWMSVLRSLTAYEIYRRLVRQRVRGDLVLRFLLQQPEFPRSVTYCLARIQRTLVKLPPSRGVERAVERSAALVRDADVDTLIGAGLSEFLDELQVCIAGIHDAVEAAYFRA